jgi:hypothetical protein
MHDCALCPEASIDDPPMVADLNSPNDTINGHNIKCMDQFHLMVPDQHSTRILPICLTEHHQCKNCSQLMIGLEAWLRGKGNPQHQHHSYPGRCFDALDLSPDGLGVFCLLFFPAAFAMESVKGDLAWSEVAQHGPTWSDAVRG